MKIVLSKKRLLLVLLALIVLLPSRSASAEKSLYALGGMTISNLSDDPPLFGNELASNFGGDWAAEKSTRAGLDIGLGMSYSKQGPWGGALEVHYVQRGADWAFDKLVVTPVSPAAISGSFGDHLDTGVELAYIEIPALLQVTSRSQAWTIPTFFFGPAIGIRASSKLVVPGNGSVDLSDQMKSTYWAGVFGGGLKMRLAPTSSLLLQTRYQFGLSNLVKSTTSVKPQDFSFHLGYARSL